ncbi:MAG TPA: flagellar type III secretion system protein FliR [Clostridiaceae bacterium]|nr:flagellar type III secretion system protein FliR [Clostridiaceae bacterium]
MTGLFVISPIFGRRSIPSYFKVGFAFMISLILVNLIEIPNPDYYNNIYGYAFLIIKEFLVGLSLGFVSFTIFSAIYVAGQLIDMQIGFGMVNVLDPVSNIQVPITSNFYFIVGMLVFLAINGQHVLIKALFDSFYYVRLGSLSINESLFEDFIRTFGNMFITGFKIAAPITAAILISDVVLGILSRTVPQLNVFVVGLPFKIIMGIVVMMISIPAFIMLLQALFNNMNSELYNLLRDLGTIG